MLDSILGAIGDTPLVHLSRMGEKLGATKGRVLAKIEAMNPGGSVKDRAAVFMLNAAVKEGKLAPGGSIVEPTSGNTGVGLAQAAAVMGFKLILTMPESMSVERRKLLKHLGAQLVLTPAQDGMSGSVDMAQKIARETGAFMPMQFENPHNADAHRRTTALEVLRQVERPCAALVCGVGTGGTITGLGETLKAHWPQLYIVAVEPQESPLLSSGVAAPHGIQGIGANFVPKLLNRDIIDAVMTVKVEDAIVFSRLIARSEGILVGISSGAALYAAFTLMKDARFVGHDILTILPDTGERYLSTALFEEE